MVLALRTEIQNAETAKQFMITNNLFDKRYCITKDKNFIYFPLIEKISSSKSSVAKKSGLKIVVVNKNLKRLVKINSIKDYIVENYGKKYESLVPSAYDVVGDIAIVEISDEQKKIEKIIAKAILECHKNIKTVLKKGTSHEGEFRLQKTKHLLGKRKKETIHKEAGVLIKLDVDLVYFSARSCTERLRVASQVRPGERVLVMFSGAAPFGLVICKNSLASEIVCIEKNPVAHKYAVENLRLNHATNVGCILGDVVKEVPKLKSKFDRIIMPLPKTAEDFLPIALKVAKKGTIIHLYAFPEKYRIGEIENRIKQTYKNIRVLGSYQCGSFSPTIVRTCYDLEVQ